MPKRHRLHLLLVLLLACAGLSAPTRAGAVILYRTGDPAENTTAPGGDLAGSGWQYQGIYSAWLGTPIAPQFFITARHLGGPAPLSYNGLNYNTVRGYPDPAGGDFTIWQIAPNEFFPTFAPLYTKNDEVGRPLVVIGRGTQRGGEVILNGELRGWSWGSGDGAIRWGTNHVSSITPFGLDNDGLRVTFDAGATLHEGHLSANDSGGAVFIQDGPLWKLAGINYAVDDLYSQPQDSAQFFAAVFDSRGYYRRTGRNPSTFALIVGVDPVPTAFYVTRISSRLPWIYSVTSPVGDEDNDGTPNLLEYALHLNPITPDAAALPKVAREGTNLTLTYTKRTTATDVTYLVEKSDDLQTWTDSAAQQQVLATSGTSQTIKASVPVGTADRLFLRVRVTRP